MLKNIKFAVSLLHGDGEDGKTLFTGSGWNQFVSFVKLRNRLVHPKNTKDLNISDQEIVGAFNSYIWFNSVLVLGLIHRLVEARNELIKISKKHKSN